MSEENKNLEDWTEDDWIHSWRDVDCVSDIMTLEEYKKECQAQIDFLIPTLYKFFKDGEV